MPVAERYKRYKFYLIFFSNVLQYPYNTSIEVVPPSGERRKEKGEDSMRKGIVFMFVVFLGVCVCMIGCGKKEDAGQQLQDPGSMATLSTMTNEPVAPAPGGNQSAETKIEAPRGSLGGNETALAPLPPEGPYKPTSIEIQTALKNAGLYTGNVDGKVGPLTKKAIEEFQKANGLKADGKVGSQTWGALGKYLDQAAEAAPAPAKKSKKR